MESSSRIYMSPSFNRHPSNVIADIADRVVQELRKEIGFGDDDVFSFSDDDNPADIGANGEVKSNNRTEIEEVEHEFEFPVVCGDSNSSPVSTDEVVLVSDDQISPRYPLFDRSLLSESDVNLSNGIDSPETDSKPAPSTRPSLRKLLSEDRDSPSISASDDLDGITPGTYCVWKPKTEQRGKHKKSISISIGNTSKRWKVRDLLKRSYSDDNYCTGKEAPVVLFIPPISPKQKTNDEKANEFEKTAKVASSVGAGVRSAKTERNIPAYKTKIGKIGNIRVPQHLQYRQDQIAAFGNFTGSSANLYRY